MKAILTRDKSGTMCMWEDDTLLHKEDTNGEFGDGLVWFGKNKNGAYVSPINYDCEKYLGGFHGLKKGKKMRAWIEIPKTPKIKVIPLV